MTEQQPIQHTVLAVEDSDEDFEAFIRALRLLDLTFPVQRTANGDEALDYLYQTGVYAKPGSAIRPALIFMDLNLPGTDGQEVIQEIKQNDQLKSIPVIVLTTSSNPKDVEACYRYGANSYILKPMGIKALADTLQMCINYWFTLSLLPDTGESIL
ncbi:MAG TPA: response regulator [Leptolyngbyaceae cyanobacterium]